MIVPKNIRNKWQKLKERDDVGELAGLAEVSTTIIWKALSGKACTEKTFTVIRDFYKQREELLKTA